MAAQRFLDALPMVVQIRDLILAVLNAYTLRHLGSHLDDAGNLMQDR
ncbi:MAG TPA: hypothetical protein VMW56_00175 [Candidatus Margulisiibacteriota bacterium]|nr:hypothetical protein [Candidatus Margulisiibacteriota bacterium]